MKNIFLLLILSLLPAQAMEVTFFNIGQGNCTLVTYPGKQSMLVDAGFSKAPAGDAHCNTVVQEIISKIKAKTPDKELFVVVSHADKDHLNLIERICQPLLKNKFSIEFLLGGGPSFYEKEEAKELVSFINKEKKQCTHTFASDITGDDRAEQFKALVPTYCKILASITKSGTQKKLDPNDTSIVVKLTKENRSVLLPGDATGNVTEALMRKNKLSLQSTVYELSHHGAAAHNCTTLDLLKAINPRIIILSTGLYGGKLQHPRFETIQTSGEFCVLRNRTNAQPHMITYQDTNGVPPFKGETDETRLNLVAINDDGFCTSQTTFPIYHTVDSGNITYTDQGISVSKSNSTHEDRGIGALVGIDTPRFNGIRFLFFNNMKLESAQIKEHLKVLPAALKYIDLRNNNIGQFGIEHLIKLYKNHGKHLIVKLADNRLVDKKALTTACKKKDFKAITTKERVHLTFSKKGLAQDTVESLEFSTGHSGSSPLQHVQAKDYAQNSSVDSEDAKKNKINSLDDDELIYEVSSDNKKLYVQPSNDEQESYTRTKPGITDICLLSDSNQTVAGLTTKERSSLFDFKKNLTQNLVGRFRYTNIKKPWKTIGKEFWTLDEPEVSYYHERTPFSKNGKFVMTVSAKNKTLNIYEIDPLVFDPRHVKLYKSISEEDLKNDLGHSIDDIKRVAFTDNDHSVKINFTDKTHGELRYIL